MNQSSIGLPTPAPSLVWSDTRGLSISRVGKLAIRLSFGCDIAMDVDLAGRRVSNSSGRALDPADAQHFLADQVHPRILAHQGALILHAAIFLLNGRSVMLIGPSGRGKSTLVASFGQAGYQTTGDDACRVSTAGGIVTTRSLYPSLRLLPDSLAAVFDRAVDTAPVGPHTIKRRVSSRPPVDTGDVPLAAIVSIAEPATGGIKIRPLSVAAACMRCVENSFALDPSDATQARRRLDQASGVARQVPAFEIAYPRDYARLPEVRQAILDELAALEAA